MLTGPFSPFVEVTSRGEAHLELNAFRRKHDCALVISGDSLEVRLACPRPVRLSSLEVRLACPRHVHLSVLPGGEAGLPQTYPSVCPSPWR